MAINYHGLKIKGIKKAASESCNCRRGWVNEFAYAPRTGEVWVKFMSDNAWTDYSGDIIKFYSDRKLTMQEIADAIAERF